MIKKILEKIKKKKNSKLIRQYSNYKISAPFNLSCCNISLNKCYLNKDMFDKYNDLTIILKLPIHTGDIIEICTHDGNFLKKIVE